LVDILGYDKRDIPVELTMAEVNPAMFHLRGMAEANRRNADDLARLLGDELAQAAQSPAAALDA
jgi:hypothetical protein